MGVAPNHLISVAFPRALTVQVLNSVSDGSELVGEGLGLYWLVC